MGRTSGAQWRRERSNFRPCFSLLEPHSLFTKIFQWGSGGPSSLKETQTVKKNFEDDRFRGHHPRALKWQPACMWQGNNELCHCFVGQTRTDFSVIYFPAVSPWSPSGRSPLCEKAQLIAVFPKFAQWLNKQYLEFVSVPLTTSDLVPLSTTVVGSNSALYLFFLLKVASQQERFALKKKGPLSDLSV